MIPPLHRLAVAKRSTSSIRVGCAGWSIPKEHADRFPAEGSHLARYAGRFPAVEINSSFYKPHRPATYARWAASVPAGFRFSVKVPKVATHERRLVDTDDVLDSFLAEATQLGDKLGPLLVQLPPSLTFSADVAERFFASLRDGSTATWPCEPRHPTWFEPEAERAGGEIPRGAGRGRPCGRPRGRGAGRMGRPRLLPAARLAEDVLLGVPG